jgi:hypothetical protein
MRHFCNYWHVRNLLVMFVTLNNIADSMVSIHPRLSRPSSNCHPFVHSILDVSHVLDNARTDRVLLP